VIVFASTLDVKLCRIVSLVILFVLLLLLDVVVEDDVLLLLSLDEVDVSLLLLFLVVEEEDVEEMVAVRPSCSCSVLSNDCMDGKRLARVCFCDNCCCC